jgi:hypothetical protein
MSAPYTQNTIYIMATKTAQADAAEIAMTLALELSGYIVLLPLPIPLADPAAASLSEAGVRIILLRSLKLPDVSVEGASVVLSAVADIRAFCIMLRDRFPIDKGASLVRDGSTFAREEGSSMARDGPAFAREEGSSTARDGPTFAREEGARMALWPCALPAVSDI